MSSHKSAKYKYNKKSNKKYHLYKFNNNSSNYNNRAVYIPLPNPNIANYQSLISRTSVVQSQNDPQKTFMVNTICKTSNTHIFKYLIDNNYNEITIFYTSDLMKLLSKMDKKDITTILNKLHFNIGNAKIPLKEISRLYYPLKEISRLYYPLKEISRLGEYNIYNKHLNQFVESARYELISQILSIFCSNEITNYVKKIMCKYFAKYILELCFRLNNLDIYSKDMHIGIDDGYIYSKDHCWVSMEGYKINTNNDILNYYRLRCMRIQKERGNNIKFNNNIFNIKEYTIYRHKIRKCLGYNVINCSRYNHKIMYTIMLSAYYHKKHGFKNLIKNILHYYFY